MATTNITLSDDHLLAEYVPIDSFKGILEQRLAIGPDMLAMLIKDGQIAEASAGAHFAVGGIWQTIKDAIGGRHALRLLIADLKPFQLTASASALTQDHVQIACEFTIDLQVNPEKAANVLGLMREHTAVTKASVLERLAPHFAERVLNAEVARVTALELRGNVGLQDLVQADVMKETERLAADIGLIARSVTVGWGTNEEEKNEILKRQQDREQQMLDRDFTFLNRQVERETQSTVVRLQADLTLEKTKELTQDELRRLVLANELNFVDARESGIRIQQMKALEHELQLNRTQRLDGLKTELEAAQHAIELTRSGGARRDVELDIATREQMHLLNVTRIRSDIRGVERSIEDADRRQALALGRLEEMQRLEIAAKAHEDQIAAMRGLQNVELDGESIRVDIRIKGDEAEHRRKMDELRQAEEAALARIQALKDATPETILAINAGFSPQVANVLVEQARAKAADGAERMALMREMIQQAQEAKVASEAQARHLFDSAMQGNVGVAQGVGVAAAGAAPGVVSPDIALGNTECPGCHRVIPNSDRHCRYCGRQMRQ